MSPTLEEAIMGRNIQEFANGYLHKGNESYLSNKLFFLSIAITANISKDID